MLQPLSLDQPILAFGDSLTFGYGATKKQSYPTQLSKLINISVINEGINGELSSEGLMRLDRLLAHYQPQLLLLCHGANDIIQNLDLDKMAANIRCMVKLAKKRKIQVLLIAVPNINNSLLPIKQYQEIAETMNIIVENKLISTVLAQDHLRSDIVHPNYLGYQQIAEKISVLLTAAETISNIKPC